nr:MAG TPA: Cytosine specific methyltransferase [Caudoviricetes sp.]
MAERPLYTLYKNLKAQNYDVPDDYNKFESALTRDGKGGADNRHAIYENLKAQNFDVPNTYERFYSALFEPRSKTSSRAKGGSVPMSAADRARFSAGAAAISASAQQTMNNAGRYNRLKQRKQKQQKDFGRVNLGTHQTPYGGDANNVVKDDFAYNPETSKTGAYVTSDNENVYSLPEAEQMQAILDKQNDAYQVAVDTGEIPSAFDVRDKNGNYDLQENIGKNGTYLTEEGAQKQFDKKLADAYARKKEIEALIAEDNRQHGNPLLSYGASIGASNGRTAEQSDYRNKLATSLSLVTEQIGALEAVKQYPTSSWGEDALKALDNTAFTAKTWDFGLTDFATMGQMERIKTKMDNNIPLSGSDKMLLKSKLGADAAAALEDEKMGNVYRWTKIAGQSLPFMADFFLTGGYGGITKGISRGALKFAAKRGMGKVSAAILKNTGIVAGDVIGSYAMAGTEQALKTGADIMQRHLGNLYQDEKGDYKFGTFDENGNLLHEGGESIGTALYKGMTSAMVENYTEKLFGHNYGIKKGAVNFMEKHGMNASAEFFKNIGKSGWYTNSKKWMEKFGINGFAEEVMEEEIGIPLHALLDGEGKVSDLLDAKQQLDIIGGMAISVGSMYAMGAGSRPVKGIYNRAQYYRFRNKVNVADSDAQNLMGDNWADIKDKIDNATNEQMGGVLADILRQRDTMTKEQINAAVNYGVNLMKMRGYNIAKTAEMNAKEITNEPTTPEEQHQADIDNAYSEGHDADDADKHDIQIQQEDQMKTLAAALGISEQQLSAMSDEELESLTGQDDKLDQAIYDYQLSSARYQGVVDDAQDKVDLAAHQAEQRVDMYTDQSRGSVRNATIKASGGLEDYGVYIISGNIATHDDGSIDVSNSDGMILYYDPTTNSVEHADALMFAELGEELPADDVKAQAVADAKENAIKEVAGIIDGTVEVGSQFNVTDTDGTEHTYEVLADYGDGTAAISIDGNVVENPYSLADLQQMKDLEDQKRLEAAKAEREQMEKERAEQKNQETEETQPSFDFNQILNDNGNVVLVDVLDKDGNTKYPDSRLFLIRDAGAKAKVVELKSDGTIVPHAVSKEDVATISSMSLDEYKQAMPESSMIEDNSGEESDEDSQLANLGLPKGSEIWMSGDGFGRPKENTLSKVVGIDEQGSIILEDKDGKKWSASFDYINNHRELPPLDENTNIVNEENNQSESNAEENTPAPEQTPAMTLEDGTIVPMLEDGNPDFSKLTAAQTAELYDTQFGEDADSIVSGYVSDAKKALDKASNMTVKGKTFVEQKAAKDAKEKAIADAQAAYDSAIAIRDAYNERQLAKVEDTAEGRKNLIEKARRKFARLKSAVKDDAEAVSQLYRDTIGSLLHRLYDSTGIDVTDTTPLTAEEYVASNLGAHSLNYEGTETSKGVKQETGLSREDFAKTQLLAADGKGTTIDALVHSLWENRPSNLESLDTQDIRNALIGVLNSGFKASEARNFVENIRIAQAENILEEQKRAQENAAYAEQHKAEPEAEQKAMSDEKAEPEAKSEAKLDNESDNESNDLSNETDNEKINDNINDNINIPEDATDENPLGAERDESDLPFSAKENGKQQTTAERAADVEKNKVDDMKVVDNIVGEKTRKAFERLAKMMGANIQWQYSDKLGNGWIQETTDADGNVHRTIFITLDSSITEGAQFIFGHEMTHQIKNLNPAAYNELTQLVLDTYGSDAFDKAVDETMKRYSDAGFSGRARDYYAEEVVADAVGEMIRDLNLAHTLAMKMSHPLLAAIHEILQKIKLAFFGTEYSDVTKNIIRSIEQAYVKTAKGQVTNSETGEDVSFSLRQKPEPKKKGIGYKVFVLKDGKLYPPMVANPDGAETPVGVWLDADAAPIAGESKTGRPQVKQGGKGTQGGSGKLAYRPGWHLGVVPYAIQFNRKDAEGNKTLFPKNFVFAEVEYAADVDYQEEARQEGINPSGKYQHSLAGLKHLPTDGYYMYRTNPNPETDPWVITGAMKVNRILTRAEQAELVKNAGREPQQIQEGDIVTDDVVNSINQEIADAPKFSLKVYHGSGADFTEFDFDHMGEGAGSQTFGWGGYVTSSKKIGKSYANLVDANAPHQDVEYVGNNAHEYTDVVAGLFNGGQRDYDDVEEFLQNGYNADKQNARKKQMLEWFESTKPSDWKSVNDGKRNLYEVDIPDDNGSNYLDFENPMSEEQINTIRDALAKKGVDVSSWEKRGFKLDLPFKDVYAAVLPMMMRCEPKEVSKFLSSIGYTGIKYPAGTIMGGAEVGDTNYVIFKPEDMKITEHTKFSLKSKPVRFEAGKKLSDEEKKEVLSTLKDAYKVNGVPYHIEETAGGKEKRVYEPTADSYVVSDITNRPLRYYITLPDGRVAHPTEVYPNISDNEVKSSATKQGLLDDEVDQIVGAAIGNMKDIADNAKAIEVLTELQNLPHETHDVGYGMNNAQSYNYKTGIFTSDAAQAIDYVVRRMRRKEDVPAEIPAALKKAVADSYGMVDNLIDGMSNTKVGADEIKPVSVGVFGNVYNQFRGKAKAAIEFLKKLGSGEATAALHHHTIGDISLVWGDKKTGLDKILRKHPEVVDNLQSIIDSMEVVQESDNRIKLESPTHFAVVSKEYKGEPREQWLLTAYEKRESLENGKSMDTATSSLGGDTALSQSKESAAKIDNSSETAKENGEKFSLKDEKTLAGVHNITEEKLLKALKLGGFANPSLAVIDTNKSGHDNFGEISFIAPSALLDKRTGKTAGTWITDAYTQRYPSVEREMSEKGYRKFEDWVDSLDYPSGAKAEIERQAKDALSDNNSPAWELMYLKEKGIDIKEYDSRIDYRWKEIISDHPNAEDILNSMKTDPELNKKVTSLAKHAIIHPTWEKVSLEVRRKMYEETGVKASPINPQVRKQTKEIFERDYAPSLLNKNGTPKKSDVKKVVEQMVKEHNDTKKYDFYLSKVKASNYVNKNGLYDDYIRWQENKLDEFGTKNRIFRGYTKDGSRKYVPETLENVSKVMREEADGQTNGSEYTSFGSFIAKLASRVDSTDEMRANKDKLSSNKDKEEFYEKWSEVYYDLAKFLYNDVFYGEQRLHDIVLQSDPKKYAKKEYGITLTPTFMKKLDALKNAVQTELKSAYFETKYNRPLRLNEFAAAVVPDNLGEDVRKGIENAGLPMYDYDPNKEGDRSRAFNEAINSSDNIRFSLKSMMAKPEGWKQANKKAIHIAEAIERDPKFSLKNLDGTLIKAGTYFSGGGLVEEGLKGIIDPVVAVEYDEKISGVYRNNFGQHIVTADVRDVDPRELVKQIDGEVEYFHASPVCKNYSQAKSNHAEVELDKETAASTADFINAIKPKVVTIENVKGYKDSDAMKAITDALDANGYTWDADVYNAADYGGYTNRERLIVRAVRDGKLPDKPKKMAHKNGWYEAVADIIPTLTEKKNGVAPWMDIRLKADGIDWRNIDKPLYVMGSAYADGKVPHAFADELLPTLRTKSGDVIVMPDGKVYRAMGRVLARVSGVSDDYKIPFSESLSHTIIGNGIPTQLTEHVIAPLLTGSDPKFSIRTYHGTGASFDKFDFSHMGEGEGSQAFGWGGYVTNSKEIAEDYTRRAKIRKDNGGFEFVTDMSANNKDMVRQYIYKHKDVDKGLDAMRKDLSSAIEMFPDDEDLKELSNILAKKNEEIAVPDNIAYLYDVDIPDDNGDYLDWDAPLTDKQKNTIIKALRRLKIDFADFEKRGFSFDGSFGGNAYDFLMYALRSTKKWEDVNASRAVSKFLSSIGFKGIKYKAGTIFGGAKEGDYNYVIFDDNNAKIVGNTKFSLRYDQFEHDLNQWKKDNNLPKDAQRPTIPQRNAGESAVDFLRRVDEYRKQMALWKTAPTYEQHLLSDDTALGEFNRELQRGSVLKRIAFQDSMLAIRKAQEAIMKEVGVDRLNMAEDAYTAENRSHGKGKNEFEEYNNEFLQPLRKAYHQMKKVLGDSYDNVRVYMMAKHGLERDAQMAFKKSLEADYEDVAQRSAAYRAYKGDMNRIINDSDLEFGRVDFTTWRQRDNALRVKYSPSYMNYRYDKMGIAYDYSGLSALFDGSDFEEAANKLIKDIESKYVTETHNLWDATNAATKKILRDGFKAGMMSKDAYEYVKGMYSHYIPLRGWDGTTADQVWDYIGGGKGAFNQTLKTAHGRTSIADDTIAYIENMAESGILLNNKNWVKQHLMLLAQNHPTSLLTMSKAWYVKSTDANGNEEWIPATPQITSQMNSNQVKAAIDAFEQKMEQMAQTGDATQKRDGLNIAYPQTHSEEREHEVRVMKDGEEYVIYVNGDPQLAQAMNNTRAHRVREIQSGKLDRAAAWLGRKMAAAYTSLSPLFIPSNYFRDLTMTLASTAIREDGRYNYLLRKNLATSWNLGFMLRDYQNGKLRDKVNNGNATPKEQMFYDFMMNGGETGFVSSLDVEDLKKKFKNDLKDLDRWKTNPVKVGHTIMDGIEFLNRAIEDSNRFAVYMTSIQYGRSIDEAVNDAKDVTLNFNRKGTGEYGWQMIRNLYLFINPAVQSLQTLGALVKHHPFKFTAVTASWLASGVLVPIVNAALMSMLGGDDDKDKYWQFTKWDRRNNLIMWVPFTHEYVKIPLAQEFRAFYGIGDMIASKMMGGELAEESWSQYAEDLLGQVVDMFPLDPTGYDGNIAVSLMPNAIRPVFELAFNVDFTGKPLFKETEYNKYDPNFTKAYVGTPDWLVRASKMVNSIGNDYPDVQQNSIDAFGDPRYNLNNPAVVDHVLSSYLGGAYTMGSQVLGVLTKSLNDPKEIKVADIPLVSKFVSNPDDRPVTKKQGDEFWDMKENHDRAANTLSKLKKQAKVDGDYSMLERFYDSEEYKQYKQDDVKVKKYEEDKKKERAEESGEEYRPHKLNAEDIYKAHATPKDDFEDLKLKQLYTKLNGFKSAYDLLVDTAPSLSDGYYNTNKAAIDAIDEISLDKQEISELKKGFLDDGKDAYNAEDMKQIRELRKKILAVLEKANKVVVANQKAKAEK